jgi:HEAT repeat protein
MKHHTARGFMVNTAASISEIIAGLTDDNPQERREAAQLLGKTGDERADLW